MASELIVQTIQGPSSGANANKVLIPSGHTLDVSGGTLVPSAGQVVQEARGNSVTSIATNNIGGFMDVVTVSLTPIYSSSIIEISGKIGVHADGNYNEAVGSRILINGSYQPSSGDGWQGIAGNGNKFLTFYHDNHQGTVKDVYIDVPISAWGNYGVTAGQVNTFKLQVMPWITTGGYQGVNYGGYNATTLIVREIKQ